MTDNQALFEQMPVPKALATLAVPTIVSQLITMIYNLSDTYFIGKTNNPYQIAAASLAYVLVFVMTALSNLFGVGGGSLISRLLGRQKTEEAKRVCAFSFYGAIVIACAYSVSCYLFMDPLLRVLGASDATIGYAASYTIWVVVVGGIPSTLSMTMAQLLRSEGYAQKASFGLGMGGILNIALDPVFMFVLLPEGQEVAGAGMATMLSNVISLCYFLMVFFRLRKHTVLSLSIHRLPAGLQYTRPVLSVGFPSALSSLLACISNMTANHLASRYGDIPVAAMGLVKKINMLPMNVGMGLCQGMLPLVAYNYAAKNYKRMQAVINGARISGMGFAVLCIIAFELFSGHIVTLFIQESETLALSAAFLRISSLATPFMISNFQMTYTLQAMGKGPESLLLSSCRQGIIFIPLMVLMNVLFGLYGVVWAQFIADGLTLVLSFVIYRRICRPFTA
ncbi:MAG: MATE family efflux transporter [Butyricicoccus sp.]|nr:MATE family efflux transporter [Butyricicoccus sp.]